MIYERLAPIHFYLDGHEVSQGSDQKVVQSSQRVRDPLVRVLSDPERPNPTDAVESQRRLKTIVDSARKVLAEGQVAIIVMVPHLVHWVTQQSQQLLSTNASDVSVIADALEPKLGGPNSELVAEHVIRTSTRAQLGIQNRNTIELRASSTKSYKADLDCYFDDPDLHAIIALLTPMNDFSRMGYEEAQLSSMRYHVGVLNSPEDEKRVGPIHADGHPHIRHSYRHNLQHDHQHSQLLQYASGYSPIPEENTTSLSMESPQISDKDSEEDVVDAADGKPDVQNHSMHDFIPSMISRELEYFYAMLPGTSYGVYSHHERELASSQSIHEQEQQAMDPDDLDPHQRMRLNQQRSLSPVLPRRPRDLAEVQAEIERSRILAQNLAIMQQHNGSAAKKGGDIRCLECGTDTSPEWRKGPEGPKTLCNRCGLRFAKKLRMQK